MRCVVRSPQKLTISAAASHATYVKSKCQHGGSCDLQAELLDMVCYDVQVEPALQPLTGEELAKGTNQAPDAIHPTGIYNDRRDG